MDSTRADSAAQRLLTELEGVFGDIAERCVIIGGVAVSFWTEPRYTKDIDFTIAGTAAELEEVTQRFLDAGYTVTRDQSEVPAAGFDFRRFIVPGTSRMVEFETARTPYQELIISRAVRMDPAQVFAMATPEDLIVLKLIANRPQDHADAVQVATRDGLDWEYIARWADTWEVTDRLEALKQVLANERQRRTDLYA